MRREVRAVERSHRFDLVPVSHTQIVPLGRRRRRLTVRTAAGQTQTTGCKA